MKLLNRFFYCQSLRKTLSAAFFLAATTGIANAQTTFTDDEAARAHNLEVVNKCGQDVDWTKASTYGTDDNGAVFLPRDAYWKLMRCLVPMEGIADHHEKVVGEFIIVDENGKRETKSYEFSDGPVSDYGLISTSASRESKYENSSSRRGMGFTEYMDTQGTTKKISILGTWNNGRWSQAGGGIRIGDKYFSPTPAYTNCGDLSGDNLKWCTGELRAGPQDPRLTACKDQYCTHNVDGSKRE